MDTSQIAEVYDRGARWFDAETAVMERAVTRRLRRKLLRTARGDVLEVGIGSGASLRTYPPGCRITGLDLSTEMIARARNKAEKLGLDVTLVRGDTQELPFEDASFDTCVSQLSFCTVPDPLAGLRELRRVCRPDGQILLLEHTTSTNRLLAPVCRHSGPVLTRSIGCHPNRPILQLVEQAGLTVQAHERNLAGIIVLIWARP